MPQVKIDAGPDDLLAIIGIMSLGRDPVQPTTAEQMAEYTTLGRQFAEMVFLMRQNNAAAATLAATQQRMVSALQVAPAEPPAAEAPVPLHPTPPAAPDAAVVGEVVTPTASRRRGG